MDRLHLHLRRLIPILALGSASASCSADEVPIPERLRGEPACMWIIDARVYFADGGMRLIFNEQNHWTGAACLCLTSEEYESEVRHDELNDMALELCEKLADQHEHVWNECQMRYDEGRWFTFVNWSVGNYRHPSGDALGCVGE